MASSRPGSKLSREEARQAKDLDAARKAGTVPAEVDAVTGKEINPHIPQYIAQAPWYIDQGHTTLTHQHSTLQKEFSNEWYQRGAVSGAATKYRKGACENCGSMTHKAKDCVERPRKLGAKITGKNIKPDEVVEQFELSFEGKRDRWNGYNSEQYMKHIEEWEKVEERRKQIRQQELDEKLRGTKRKDGEPDDAADGATGADEDDAATSIMNDEDKYADEADMAGQKVDTKTRITVRNLRIREDTAKYLRNLDVNSAHYDPKTRSMRDNPHKDVDANDLTFAGDNFLRYSGDTRKMAEMQMFVWQAHDKGSEVHLQADPTQAEILNRQFQTKKAKLSETAKDTILQKYGGEEHLEAIPKELLFSQSERYVEYSKTGQLIKGAEEAVVRSKYEEDVCTNNHTSVWGSFWEDGRWGYGCCHQYIKNSYCTGAAGIAATAGDKDKTT